MSHFTVLVVGNDPESQLAPFNEQPKSPSPYLVFTDEEDENRKEYEEGSSERIVLEDGTLVLPWDDRFRKHGSIGTGSNTHEVPAHLERRKIPFKELFPTFEEYMSRWCGYVTRDTEHSRYGRWSNPQAKWDGYTLGGCWSGMFLLRDGAESGKLEKPHHNPFSRSANDRAQAEYNAKLAKGLADQALKKDIDFGGIEREAVEGAEKEWASWEKFLNGRPVHESWVKTCERCVATFKDNPYDEAREAYNSQELVKESRSPDGEAILGPIYPFGEGIDAFLVGKERYIDRARKEAVSTFAVLKGGVWYERGGMGWWGVVHDEKGTDVWLDEFHRLISDLPDNTLLSVYDCHI